MLANLFLDITLNQQRKMNACKKAKFCSCEFPEDVWSVVIPYASITSLHSLINLNNNVRMMVLNYVKEKKNLNTLFLSMIIVKNNRLAWNKKIPIKEQYQRIAAFVAVLKLLSSNGIKFPLEDATTAYLLMYHVRNQKLSMELYNQYELNGSAKPITKFMLSRAVSRGYNEMIPKLMDNMKKLKVEGVSIATAAGNNNWETIKILESRGIKLKNRFILMKVLKRGTDEMAKHVIATPQCKINGVDDYGIRIASRRGKTEIVKLLLQNRRVNPAARDNEALRYACLHGHLEVVKLLLQHRRVDPTACGNKPLANAAKYKHREIVDLLLSIPKVRNSLQSTSHIVWESKNGYKENVMLFW